MMAHQSQHIGIHLQTRSRAGRDARGGHHHRLRAGRRACAAWPRSPTASTSSPWRGPSPASPIELVKCRTVDLEVPASAEIVVEGYVDPTFREAEAPFGEYTGYMGTRVANPVFHVTGIMHRKTAGLPGVPQPVPAVGEQPHPQARLRRGLPQAPALGQHPRRARRAAARGHGELRPHGHPAQEDAPVAAVAGAALGGGARPDHRQDDRGRRRRHRPQRRRLRSTGRWPTACDLTSTCTSSTGKASILDPSSAPPEAHVDEQRFPPPGGHLVDPHRRHAQVGLPAHLAAAQGVHGQGAERWEAEGLPPLSLKKPWFGYELGYWTDEAREDAEAAVEGGYLDTGARLAIHARDGAVVGVRGH